MGFVVDQDFRDLNELQLDILIAETDRQINRQLDEILHHPDFQQLEASWVGIRRLVSAVPPDMESSDRLADVDESSHDGIIVSLWNCSKQELLSDLRDNSSHHKTELSKKVYRESYNVYGGKPFSILIGDYVFSPNNEDCFMLREISKVVSLSFTVFVAGASSSVFGLDSFRDIGRLGWEYAAEYLSDSVARQEEWSVLRSYSESKFLALTVPKILGRRPYDYRRGLGSLGATAGWRDQDSHCVTRFRETLSPDGKNNLWVNAAFEFGAVAVDCYAKTGWLADIHGIPDDGAGGGIAPVVNKDLDRFIDSGSVEVLKPLVEVSIPDHLEKELTDLGFLTLTNRHLTEMSVFCNTPSLNAPSGTRGVRPKASLHAAVHVVCSPLRARDQATWT